MTKEETRQHYLQKREKLADKKTELDTGITKKFFTGFSFAGSQVIHIYLPIKKFYEVNTNLLIKEFKKRKQRISVPKISGDDLLSIEITEATTWKENHWQIPEPENGALLEPHQFDIIIVPLLAYDQNGNRVGYGKGYYDRFLKQCRKDALKIGLSYFPPEENFEDLHQNDIPLDFCVTPSRIYEF